MKLRNRPPVDQYHAFTARLAAAGYQRTVMRVVAGCIVSMALPAVLAGLVPATVPWPGFRLAYLAIAAVTVALAIPWLRYRWPSRTESAFVVLAGTLALAGGCLATTDPMAGLVIASAFSCILGFTALFHSTRLLAFAFAMAGLTVTWLGVRIAATEIPTALAVITPIMLLCVVTTFGCRTIATVGGSAASLTEIDPLTGLLTRDGFSQCVANLLGARNREDDRYLVVAVIELDNLAAIASLQGRRQLLRIRVDSGRALRDTARRDAAVAHPDDSTFLIADVFTTADPSALIERVRGAVAGTPHGVTASIGVVSIALQPLSDMPPEQVIDDVVDAAVSAMRDARAAGGNQARYVMDPRLGPC